MHGVLLIGFFNIFGEGFRVSGRLSQRLEGDGGLAACMNSDNRKLTLFLLIYTDPSVPGLTLRLDSIVVRLKALLKF